MIISRQGRARWILPVAASTLAIFLGVTSGAAAATRGFYIHNRSHYVLELEQVSDIKSPFHNPFAETPPIKSRLYPGEGSWHFEITWTFLRTETGQAHILFDRLVPLGTADRAKVDMTVGHWGDPTSTCHVRPVDIHCADGKTEIMFSDPPRQRSI